MPLNDTIDPEEVRRFSALADQWWDPAGKFRPLHKFNPVRLQYIRSKCVEHFGLNSAASKPLEGLRILDIGCGGGLLCEPMTKIGADVLGADASETNIGVAQAHAEQSGLQIDYRATTAEALAAQGESFDIVLNMEVVEHVSDVPLFLSACAQMVRPGGIMFVATINRTAKAMAFAIVGAEYVLRWLPKGTHTYDKLVTPDELDQPLSAAGLELIERHGVSYQMLADRWQLSTDTDVNYLSLYKAPE
jgi:2-polyprenyl-6-hydroxyphenyl methylase/3-demethylubiquinone-9 3-methyltransferase